MATVTSTEFQQNVGKYNDLAMREPVVITKQNREALVLLSVEDYKRLKQPETLPENLEGDKMTDEDKKRVREFMEAHRRTMDKLAL